MRTDARSRAGIVLLMVLAILGLLSILAVTFVNLSNLERSISQNYILRTRAIMVAESGIEYARSRLLEIAGTTLTPDLLFDFEYEEGDVPGLAHAVKVSFSTPDDPAISGVVGSTLSENGDVYKLHVQHEDGKLNLNDSNGLWNIDTDTDPDPTTEFERVNAPARLEMAIKNIGDVLFPGDPGLGGLVALTLMQQRSLLPGDQFESLDQVKYILVPGLLNTAQWDQFSRYVALNGWQDPHTLRPTFQCAISVPASSFRPVPAQWNRDVYLWTDFQTKKYEIEPRCPVHLNSASAELIEALIRPLQGWYLREGPGSSNTFEHRGICLYTTMGGTPVNEYFWRDASQMYLWDGWTGTVSNDCDTMRLGQAFLTPDLNEFLDGTFPKQLANALYDRIHGGGGNPVESWQEFEAVLDAILLDLFPNEDISLSQKHLDLFWENWNPSPSGMNPASRWGNQWWSICGGTTYPRSDYITPGEVDKAFWRGQCREILRDLLMANFNPNSQLNSYNADRHINRRIDKSKLTRYSTEFCLQPAGYFSIDSWGGILDADRRVNTGKEIHAVIQLFEPYRVTTQAQFTEGCASPAEWCEPSQTGLPVPFDSLITTYPEPVVAVSGLPGTEYARSCSFDGFIAPSTYSLDFSSGDETMIVKFDGKLEPDLAVESTMYRYPNTLVPNPPLWALEANNGPSAFPASSLYRMRNRATVNPLTGECDPDNLIVPGSLLPDGALSDLSRGLGYRGVNVGDRTSRGYLGGLQFWFKPNFDTSCSMRYRTIFNFGHERAGMGNRWNKFCLFYAPHYGLRNVEVADNVYFIMRCYSSLPPYGFTFTTGNIIGPYRDAHIFAPTSVSAYPNQDPLKRETHNSYYSGGHEWHHVVMSWDLTASASVPGESVNPDVRKFLLNGRNPVESEGPLQANDFWGTPQSAPFINYLHNSDCYVRFGGAASESAVNYGADCSFDEIVAYDTQHIPLDDEVIYNEVGRYFCPESETETPVYQSPLLDIRSELKQKGKSVTLLAVAWTAWWPDNNRRVNNFNGLSIEENPELMPRNLNAGMPLDEAQPDPLVALRGWSRKYDPVSVDVAGVSDGATKWLSDTNGDGDAFDDHTNALCYAGGSKAVNPVTGNQIRLQTGDQLAFRVYFNLDFGQRVYETPTVDDVTFFFLAEKVLQWKLVNE